MKFFFSLLLLCFLFACQSKKKEATSPITGKWEYKTIELYGGDTFDLANPSYQTLNQQHLGLRLQFSDGKIFTVTQQKPGQSEEFVARQDYELQGDTILRLKNTGRPDDEFPIISISDSLFKVNLFKSAVGYLVFRRVE